MFFKISPCHLSLDDPSVTFKSSPVCPLLPVSVVLSQTRSYRRSPSMTQNSPPWLEPFILWLPIAICLTFRAVHNLNTADFSHVISWGPFSYKCSPNCNILLRYNINFPTSELQLMLFLLLGIPGTHLFQSSAQILPTSGTA